MHDLGSPPRVRGKGPCRDINAGNIGITPACAGKSIRPCTGWLPMGDHPRVCGEKTIIHDGLDLNIGSPPRVRGKEPFLCAICTNFWDHPRVCGEKQAVLEVLLTIRGSPPRVRGKETDRQGISGRARITPACAGKSCLVLLPFVLAEDHPRVCGEK